MTPAPNPAELAALATGRTGNRFADALTAGAATLAGAFAGRRVLVVGGAGSIGSATVRRLAALSPAALHVADVNENGLAELVRDLRGGPEGLPVREFRTVPVDFGSPLMARWLATAGPYDAVLNFAAVKHVRSEKDAVSLLHMLDVNVVKMARFADRLAAAGFGGRYFCVSTDKAANPTSLMGASKRVLEHLLLAPEAAAGRPFAATSARFANVAFSDGSLLDGWLKRLQKRQPLAVPRGVRRYFISAEEAASICVLATACCAPGRLLVPDLDPARDLKELERVAEAVLRRHGYEPRRTEREDDARGAVERDAAQGRWPLLLTPLDTSGEKPYEEFSGTGDVRRGGALPGLAEIEPAPPPPGALARFLERAAALTADPAARAAKEDVVAALAGLVPSLAHVETGRTLDDRL